MEKNDIKNLINFTIHFFWGEYDAAFVSCTALPVQQTTLNFEEMADKVTMDRKFLSFTWKGIIFGSVLWGIFIVFPLTVIIKHFYPELDDGIVGGVLAGVITTSSFFNWCCGGNYCIRMDQ